MKEIEMEVFVFYRTSFGVQERHRYKDKEVELDIDVMRTKIC